VLRAVQAEYQRAVLQLAFLVACLYTAVGLFRLGFLIRFLSHPVITGFTSGAALVIAAGQVGVAGLRIGVAKAAWLWKVLACITSHMKWPTCSTRSWFRFEMAGHLFKICHGSKCAPCSCPHPQVKYILGVSYQKQDTLQGELGSLIKQLQLGNFKWQEFVMGMAMLGFLISLKLIQKK
jgi:hypothetical protein